MERNDIARVPRVAAPYGTAACIGCGDAFERRSARSVRCTVCQHEHEKAARRDYWRKLRLERPDRAREYDRRGARRRSGPDSGFDHSGVCADCGEPIFRYTRRTVRCPVCQARHAMRSYKHARVGMSA